MTDIATEQVVVDFSSIVESRSAGTVYQEGYPVVLDQVGDGGLEVFQGSLGGDAAVHAFVEPGCVVVLV